MDYFVFIDYFIVFIDAQVVSGVLYSLELKVANSKADAKICKVKVWVQPWLNKEEVTDASCESEASTKKKVCTTITKKGFQCFVLPVGIQKITSDTGTIVFNFLEGG